MSAELAMFGNVISAVSQFLTPDIIDKMALASGIPDATLAREAVGAAAPAILSGLANLASSPQGARRLADAIAKQSPNVLAASASMIGGAGRLAVGQSLLASLLGSASFDSLASAIGKFVGVGGGPVRSLLGMLTPIILGVLGREAGAGAGELRQLLASQKEQFSAVMPPGLSDRLTPGGPPRGHLGTVIGTSAPVRGRASAYGSGTDGVDTGVQAMSRPAPRSWNRAYLVLPLLLLAGLAWLAFGPERSKTVAVMPPAAPTTSVPDDLGRQITSAIDALNSLLQIVQDSASTADALPKLRQAASEFDRLRGLANRLPIEARDRLAEAVKAPTASLQATLDVVNSSPRTPADVKSEIAALRTKLDSPVMTRGSLAQPRTMTPDGKVGYLASAPKDAVSLRAYIDRDIYNTAGEKIGVIKDLVLSPEARAAAAVIGVGGFLGIGEKDIAVTLSSIQRTPGDNDWRLVTDATKDALKQAPVYQEKR